MDSVVSALVPRPRPPTRGKLGAHVAPSQSLFLHLLLWGCFHSTMSYLSSFGRFCLFLFKVLEGCRLMWSEGHGKMGYKSSGFVALL